MWAEKRVDARSALSFTACFAHDQHLLEVEDRLLFTVGMELSCWTVEGEASAEGIWGTDGTETLYCREAHQTVGEYGGFQQVRTARMVYGMRSRLAVAFTCSQQAHSVRPRGAEAIYRPVCLLGMVARYQAAVGCRRRRRLCRTSFRRMPMGMQRAMRWMRCDASLRQLWKLKRGNS